LRAPFADSGVTPSGLRKVRRPVRVLWVALAVATGTLGFASASCGSGGGQAGSSLSSALSSAGSGLTGSGPTLPGTGLPTTSTPSVTVTTTSPPVTTTSTGSDDDGVSGWVYALAGALIVALIVGVVWLFRRGKASPAVPVATPKPLAERQAILLAEVEQRLRSGWTVVSQTADTATLERSGGVTRITVDEFGTLHEIPTGPTE
jgi:hypothetical protein